MTNSKHCLHTKTQSDPSLCIARYIFRQSLLQTLQGFCLGPALNDAFTDFLQVGELRADQMTFINTIILYLSKNGTINKTMLYDSPFRDINNQGINGVFDLEKKKEVEEFLKTPRALDKTESQTKACLL